MAELIRGRYEPLEVVGAGGQSTVLRALDHETGRMVGLKVRPRGSTTDRGSLLSEARILLGLEPHPLLCRVLEDFFTADRYFLVMDWVEGVTLADVVHDAGRGLPLPEVVRYLSQVAEALDHLHRHRPPVVHGDVKPANVIVTPSGRAVLVDFGISHRAPVGGSPKPTAGLTGTAGYAAPEVGSGLAATPAADVFSLAATAFALLTGRPPQPGARPAWTGMDAERARLLEFALRRGLAVDPARRPATATALVDALQGQLRTPNNLPAHVNAFIGRATEVAEVRSLLASSRLLTLTGAGGMGKSRLAVHVLAEELADYPNGAFVVDVAAQPGPAFLIPAVLDALAPAGSDPDDRASAVVELLERRNVVLLLDGCETARAACAELATSLLAACPHVRILVTSREPLRCPAETVYGVPGLPAPDPFRLPAFERLDDHDAIRLFVERAAEGSPGFDVRAADAPGLAQLCRRLDGIPLALELAAGRVGCTSFAALALDVAERFPLLDGGRRRPSEQEATVRAAVDWACETLPAADRALLHGLSVFAGGFTTEAAATVCDGVSPERLERLARRSLVGTDGSRWSIHDAVRRLGEAQLARSGAGDDVRSRHAGWALGLAGEAAGVERANVRAASTWTAQLRRDQRSSP